MKPEIATEQQKTDQMQYPTKETHNNRDARGIEETPGYIADLKKQMDKMQWHLEEQTKESIHILREMTQEMQWQWEDEQKRMTALEAEVQMILSKHQRSPTVESWTPKHAHEERYIPTTHAGEEWSKISTLVDCNSFNKSHPLVDEDHQMGDIQEDRVWTAPACTTKVVTDALKESTWDEQMFIDCYEQPSVAKCMVQLSTPTRPTNPLATAPGPNGMILDISNDDDDEDSMSYCEIEADDMPEEKAWKRWHNEKIEKEREKLNIAHEDKDQGIIPPGLEETLVNNQPEKKNNFFGMITS